jgi:hypothetical protein
LATTTTEIADLFLSRISDYRLDTIFNSSGSLVLNTYMEPWIFDSIVEFDGICNQVLNYTPTSGSVSDGFFSVDLTMKNKIVLSQIMVVYWLEHTVSDILQLSNALQDRDFRTFSQAQNLDAKQKYLAAKREEVSQILNNYSYLNNDWADWRNQIFA